MNKYDYDGPSKFRPLSPWAYVGYSILFAIPIIGWIILIVLTFNSDNINRRSFARSYWASALIIAIIASAVFIFGGFSLQTAFAEQQSIGDMLTSFAGSLFGHSDVFKQNDKENPSDFKEFLDSYEAFMDEYIDFIATYDESSSDIGMLADYSMLLLQYADMAEKIESIDEDELTEDELAYYLEVTARVYTKLAAIEMH